jgi:AcrR family transcriptional regulator
MSSVSERGGVHSLNREIYMVSSAGSPYGDPATRRRILDAAWELVEERGAAVRVADVAARADVSRQAVYLHCGDRTGLLLALVAYMDERVGVGDLLAPVFEAATAVEALDRLVVALAAAAPRIDAVARVLEGAREQDVALRAAFRNRMARRHATHRAVVQRLDDEGRLADGWTVDAAADLFHAIAMPATWRELTHEHGWSQQDYVSHLTRLLHDSFVTAAHDDPKRAPNDRG